LKGRVAERRLVELGLGQSRNVTLRKDDQWEERDEEYEPIPLSSDDELDRLFEDVNVGIDSEEVIHHFNDQFLSTNHPDPPADATDEQVRTCDSDFVQGPDNKHPSSVNMRTVLKTARREGHFSGLDDQYCNQCNAVERHKHSAYCSKILRKRKKEKRTGDNGQDEDEPICDCRFKFGKQVTNQAQINIIEKVDKDGNTKYTIEMVTRRNDAWINGHDPFVLMFWQANVDCQLIVDLGKVSLYMSKYVTKTEADCSKSMASIMKRIMVQAVAEGRNVQFVLRKAMARLMGQRIKSQQEVCHLILSLPLVSCTHTFVRISLRNNIKKLIVEQPANVQVEDGQQEETRHKNHFH
jgi:hypothetical protein